MSTLDTGLHLIRTASQRVSAVNDRMSGKLKSWMPTGLYARALLIMIVPMVVLQSVVAFVFMERHWNTATRRLSAAVVQDIATLIDVYQVYPQDKGREAPNFRPRGAREVRRAAQAFLEMKGRVERSIEQRTAMLAGVSHDLRTILARFKLELALIGDSPEVDAMRKDVDEMSAMLEAYLAFARGDSGEQAQPTDMALALEELRSDAERNGHAATVAFHGLPIVTVKPASFKRCLANLVSNAARHANAISITGHRDHRYLTVTIDDDGPGIAPDMREEVFKPFLRLDDARNQDEGGTGLGLAIARDIARSHGGDITLGDSPTGGLRAAVRIPV